MTTKLSTNKIVPVAHEWMAVGFSFEAHVDCLRVTHPGPFFTYQQNGRTHVSRDPLARVEFETNEGLERGVARLNDLRTFGIAVARREPAVGGVS